MLVLLFSGELNLIIVVTWPGVSINSKNRVFSIKSNIRDLSSYKNANVVFIEKVDFFIKGRKGP